MTKNLTVALAAGALLLSAFIFPASAGPLLSLTGVVGDANWSQADPAFFPLGSFELFRDISSVFQGQRGPGGFITVDFGGPAVIASRDQEIYSFFPQSPHARILPDASHARTSTDATRPVFHVGYWVDDIVGPDAVGQPFSLTVSAVPEPFTLSLFGAGVAGSIALRRRKRRAA